jgi:TRAP-type mannitol/chloroaromatic compound transport system permease small subunit
LATVKTWLRIAGRIDALNKAVAGVVRWAVLANALLIAGNALSRKLFSVSAPVIYDLQWHFLAAVVMLMAGYTLMRDEHVRVDVLAHRVGERGIARLDLVGIVAVLLPICLLMVWATTPELVHAMVAGEIRATPESMSSLPAWIIKSFIPAGFLLLALQGVAEAIRCVACLRGIIRRPVHRRQLIDHAEPGA